MRLKSLSTRLLPVALTLLILLVVACQGPPPTEYVIITSTPQESPTPTPEVVVTVIVVTATTDVDLPNQTPIPTLTPADLTANPTSADAASLIPTATFSQIQVAEQPFEHGRMFWLEPIDQVWVLIENPDDKRSGVWLIFDDVFDEGEVEFDPEIVPPSEDLLQPERGFGELWRTHSEIRDALGWATRPEIGFVSTYHYQPAGEIVDGAYVRAPGFHLLSSGFASRTYRFNEINGTWQQLRNE